ncbi:MAG: S-adenosylmethionine:tRNA ribosyltransferase-isomerase [Prevotellaceae bacterium]|jgi:S-adenosylmethionine:tRNA ribosyltransferase-isomerase|nr:S-adenosylmethionine:tRNA ribosyltransferase-isomerase [Prevotellaceae bacterium]
MIPDISINKFTYELPDERIAKFPLAERDQSKLLLYWKGQISEDIFLHISDYFNPGDMLVFNNTKVIHARLVFYKNTGARIEVFCMEPVSPSTFEQALASKNTCTWLCMIGNFKKWKNDILSIGYKNTTLTAEKLEVNDTGVIVRFAWEGTVSFGELMEHCGAIPIPPYLKREPEDIDNTRYQTVYSKYKGSVAAPTAGLHFTNSVLAKLKHNGVDIEELTLHVGAGTFKSVKADFIAGHEMHIEHFRLKLEVLEKLISKAGDIISVGTTSIRMLESLYWLGLNIKKTGVRHVGQWQPYENEEDTSVTEALYNIMGYMKKEKLTELDASTQIMIVPSYRFRMIKGLVTNFHQPQSTLLLLIAALIGNNWRKIYDYALQHNFRFLSYGDSSLLLP